MINAVVLCLIIIYTLYIIFLLLYDNKRAIHVSWHFYREQLGILDSFSTCKWLNFFCACFFYPSAAQRVFIVWHQWFRHPHIHLSVSNISSKRLWHDTTTSLNWLLIISSTPLPIHLVFPSNNAYERTPKKIN